MPKKIKVTETSAEVDLQEILNLTAKSISDVVKIPQSIEAKLVVKWGFGGSAGQSNYKQKFSDPDATDSYLFLLGFVPLKLIDMSTGFDLWTNPRPSSTYYCVDQLSVYLRRRLLNLSQNNKGQKRKIKLNRSISTLFKVMFQKLRYIMNY